MDTAIKPINDKDLWSDAYGFSKTFLPADVGAKFAEFCKARNYNLEEISFFTKMLADAIDLNFTIASMKYLQK